MRRAVLVCALFAVACRPVAPNSNSPAVRRIVVLGDSVAHGAGDEKGGGIASLLHAANLGINGARTYDVARVLTTPRAQDAVRRADAIVLSIGGNDMFGDPWSRFESFVAPAAKMQITLARVEALVEKLRTANATARIYVVGLYNPYRTSPFVRFLDEQVARWDSGLIAQFANLPNVDVIRIADLFAFVPRLSPIDHFHPNHQGYALIAQRIAMTFQ